MLFEGVLEGEARIQKRGSLPMPLVQTPVIEHLHVIGDDERDDVPPQALLEHDQAPYAFVAILERVDEFKVNMEVNDVVQSLLLNCIVPIKQKVNFFCDVFGQGRLVTSRLIGQFLVLTDLKPIFSPVTGPAFQPCVQLLDEWFAERKIGAINNLVNGIRSMQRK